jgi:hypothetical protein
MQSTVSRSIAAAVVALGAVSVGALHAVWNLPFEREFALPHCPTS